MGPVVSVRQSIAASAIIQPLINLEHSEVRCAASKLWRCVSLGCFARCLAVTCWFVLSVNLDAHAQGQPPAAQSAAAAPAEAAAAPPQVQTPTAQPPAAAPAQLPAETPAAQPPHSAQVAPVPLKGSQIPLEENRCATCHTEPALWDETKQRLLVSMEDLQQDVHFQKGVNCTDCHLGDHTKTNFAEAHIGLVPVKEMQGRCGVCHSGQKLDIIKGVHAKVGDKDEQGRGTPLGCNRCHGMKPHHLLPVKNQNSPVFLNNQVQTCGACHQEDQKTFGLTVHGTALNESGLLVTAVCADCHGAHGIYYAADRRSTLNPANVATTCEKCHKLIGDKLAGSVHGQGVGLGAATQSAAPGGKVKRHPTCTDCHVGHHISHTSEAEFRLHIANNCGNCHAAMSSHYALSMHGELTQKGYASAAECADCHGSHNILPVRDPKSQVAAGENRLQTCRKCHTYAVANFTKYDPHANFKDEAQYPWLHGIYLFIQYAVNILFAFYLLHAFVWFARAVIQRLQFGGHKTLVADKYALPRIGPFHQASYAALIVSFIGLMATGVALQYSHLTWGKWLAELFGGFQSASVWHHFFAVVATGTFLVHMGRAVFKVIDLRKRYSWKEVFFGPDSLIPTPRDLRDFGRMCLWFIGYSRKPGFERWTYWEKLDYWAFILVALLIGLSGMMLWYPNLFCVVLPGSILNVAKVVHSQFAIYMASVLLLIHFFHGHFRPEKFPMDLSVITGLVSEQHLRENRPEYIARLEREGRLEEMRTVAPSRSSLWFNVLGGVVVFTLGIGLLVVSVLASLGE